MLHPHVAREEEKPLIISYRSIIVFKQLYCLFHGTTNLRENELKFQLCKEFRGGMEFPKLLEFLGLGRELRKLKR